MADQIRRGLVGVPGAESELTDVDDEAGALSYRGYPIAELAERATFEEVSSLRWNGPLPTRSELDSFTGELCSLRGIDAPVVQTLERLTQRDERSSDA